MRRGWPRSPFVSPFVLVAENGGFWLLLAPLLSVEGEGAGPCRVGIKLLIIKEWREGVGVEPTRDVYSPMLDLKSRRPTGTLTLPPLFN